MSYLKAQICAFLSKSKDESPETFRELVVMEQQDADFAASMQGKAINLIGTNAVPGLTNRGEFALLQEEFFWDHTENVDSKEGEEGLEEIKDELKRAQEYLEPLATNKNKPLKLAYDKICDSLQEEDFTGNRIGEYMKEIEGTYGDEGMYDGDLAPDSEYSKSLHLLSAQSETPSGKTGKLKEPPTQVSEEQVDPAKLNLSGMDHEKYFKST